MTKSINENVKITRGWDGKLDYSNRLCGLIVELNLVSETLIKSYENCVHQYYRYYNDGDTPRLIRGYGVKKSDGEKAVEEALETEIVRIMSLVISQVKSTTKLRTFLRKQKSRSRIFTIKSHIDDNDLYSVLPVFNSLEEYNSRGYWFNQLLENDLSVMPELTEEIKKLSSQYTIASSFIKEHTPELSNIVYYAVIESYSKMEEGDIKQKFFDIKESMKDGLEAVSKILGDELAKRPEQKIEELEQLIAA